MRSLFAILASMVRARHNYSYAVFQWTHVPLGCPRYSGSASHIEPSMPIRSVLFTGLISAGSHAVSAPSLHTPLDVMRCLNSLAGERSSFKRPIMNEAIQIIQTLNSNPPHPPPYPPVKGLFWPLAVMSESASFENKLRERQP